MSHSFDRFYVVTKFELPKVEDLKLITISYDSNCQYLDDAMNLKDYPTELIRDMKNYCVKIAPYVDFYKKQTDYYNQTAYEITTNELALILPTFSKQERQKRGIVMSLIIGFISVAYEGISSSLYYKRQKALHKAVQVMENKVDLQHNRVFHLGDSMIMYGIYNSDTLETLIDTVHRLHNQTTWNEQLFPGKINNWYGWYLSEKGVCHYAINLLLFFTTVREKCVKMYERFINQLRMYSKGYLPSSLLLPSKLNKILQEVKAALQTTNRDYDLVIKRLYLYYDMKFVTFGIDDQRNLIIQFPVFVQPYTQQHLILYQMETVLVPIVDKNKLA